MDTGLVIAVPEDISVKILQEGYHCSRRRRVPASRNRESALRAYRRCQHSRPPVLLEVVSLPRGVATTPHKDGLKLEISHLPAGHLRPVARPHSVPSPVAPQGGYHNPPPRTVSHRPSPAANQMPGTRQSDRQQRLARRDNVRQLCHATRESNANSILSQQSMRSGNRGFLGPGIYFSRTSDNARRYCQCRTGHGPIVVIHCQVNLGNVRTVPRGEYTGQQLLADGCDSYEENGRDCYMLPDNEDRQILMNTMYIER